MYEKYRLPSREWNVEIHGDLSNLNDARVSRQKSLLQILQKIHPCKQLSEPFSITVAVKSKIFTD